MSRPRLEAQHYAAARRCLERARIARATERPAWRAAHHFEGWLLLARCWREKARAARALRLLRARRKAAPVARALVPWTHPDSPFMDLVDIEAAPPWSWRD